MPIVKDGPTIPVTVQVGGSITLFHGGDINKKNCSDIKGNISRVTNTFMENQTTEVRLTSKASGGQIGNGCSYSVRVKTGSGTMVSAQYPVSLLNLPNGPNIITGWAGPFDLNGNMVQDIVMYMQFF